MGCNSCVFLQENKAIDGKLCGSIYYCSKCKKYVNGSNNACDNYSYDYSKNTYIKNKIYEEGRKYSNDDTPNSIYLIYIVIFMLLAIYQFFINL